MKEYVMLDKIHKCADDGYEYGCCRMCLIEKRSAHKFKGFMYTVDGYEGCYCHFHAKVLASEYMEDE